MANKAVLHITVVLAAAPRTVHECVLTLPMGSTALQALQASGVLDDLSPAQRQPLELCIWGRKASGAQALRDGDRVELCRPLTVDPKVARRTRFARQGTRGTGLFARRTGAKPGKQTP